MDKAHSTLALNWHVIYTYPQYEKKVFNDLTKNNIGCYLPLQKVIKHWSDRKKLVEAPLFPNYVFVNTSPSERYKVLGIHGVSRFITIDGRPVIICEQEIETIRQVLTKPESDEEDLLHVGDKVKVNSGLFADLEGVISEKGKKKIRIKLKGVNQFLTFELVHNSLVKI